MEIDVNRVQADQEIDEGFFLFFGDKFEKGIGKHAARWEWRVDTDVESKSFGVDIANLYTTFMSEKDRISFARGGNTDVIFCIGWMGKEGLENEVVEGTGYSFDLLSFSGSFNDPLLGFIPSFIESEETSFTTTFDKLIGFCDELCGKDPAWELSVWSDSSGCWIPRNLSNFWRRIDEFRGNGGRWVYWGSSLEPVGQ
jgi:hypothetical protein